LWLEALSIMLMMQTNPNLVIVKMTVASTNLFLMKTLILVVEVRYLGKPPIPVKKEDENQENERDWSFDSLPEMETSPRNFFECFK